MHVFLATDRLVLRRFTPEDIEVLVALDSDPLVRHFVEDGEPVNDSTAAEMIEHFLGWYQRSEVFGFWAAIEKSSGDFIGWFHLRPHDAESNHEPELGYRLVSSAWGKGYASEGSQALIDRAFESPGVQRVVAETMTVHTASRRVMEHCGMRLVRSFRAEWPVRIPSDEHGDVEYAITRPEWRSRRTHVRGS